ncbi:MAG: protein phosphatase 2C domain-containing protein [Patescibacteria group bacterium]
MADNISEIPKGPPQEGHVGKVVFPTKEGEAPRVEAIHTAESIQAALAKRSPDQVLEMIAGQENPLSLKSFGSSEASIKHPDRDEDAIAIDMRSGIAMVFDGVGGATDGDKASRAARNLTAERLNNIPLNTDPEIAKNSVRNALQEASQKVHTEVPGGGSTATVVKFIESGGQRRAIIGQVGDSRAYILRGDSLRQITSDQGLVSLAKLDKPDEIVEQKRIGLKLDQVATPQDLANLTAQERYFWDNRNLIDKMVGDETIEPQIYQVALQDGDRIILTSDGVHDNLTQAEIDRIVKSNPPDLAKALTEKAKARSQDASHVRHKPDDISAVVVDVEPRGQASAGRVEGNQINRFDQQQSAPPDGEKPTQTEKPPQVHDLQGGKEITLNYEGKPIKVILPAGQVLEVGDPRNLNIEGSDLDGIIIDRSDLKTNDLRRNEFGYKGLREGEKVILGRLSPGRFRFGTEVSRQHLEISREKGQIVIRDLNSKYGTKVETS